MGEPPPEFTMDVQPEAPNFLSSIYAFAAAQPAIFLLLTVGSAWYAATQLRSMSGGVRIAGSTGGQDKAAAMAEARARQQAALSAAAAARTPQAGNVHHSTPGAVATMVEPAQQEARQQMPARMRQALEREEMAARVEARRQMPGGPAPPPSAPSPAVSSSVEPAARAPAAASTKKQESVAEKLARIERGKGSDPDFNPLGPKTGSSAGSHFNKSKKGGG